MGAGQHDDAADHDEDAFALDAGPGHGGDVGDDGTTHGDADDRYADDLAALHGVATLPPAEPDERLHQWLEAGLAALGADRGVVLLGVEGLLWVRASAIVAGSQPRPPRLAAGTAVTDDRVTRAIHRRSTVAMLDGPAVDADRAGLGTGSLVVSPLWVSGEPAGAVAFCAPVGHPPYSTWALALLDLVADGVARVLEHHADARALDDETTRAAALIDLIPDPIVRLGRDGRRVDLADGPSDAPFDPCASFRAPGEVVDEVEVGMVCASVRRALDSGDLQTAVFTSGIGKAVRRVEARFVPAPDDEALCIVRDITERHRAEQALAEQLAFEALITAISTRLVGCGSDELDEAIFSGLEEVASFFAADRATIDELIPEGSTLRLAHQWHRPGHDGARRMGHRLEPAGSWWLTSRFEQSGPVMAGPGPMPPEAVAASLVGAGDRGALWVPLGVGEGLVGVLGFAWCRRAPSLGDELLALVRLAGDAFHGALRRRSVALLADAQARVFESIARGKPVASSLLETGALLAEHTPGARVVILILDHDQLAAVTDGSAHRWADWFGALTLDLDNPYGQAVITGEPVVVADATGDPRFGGRAVPDPAHRAVRVLPVRSSLDGRTLGLVVIFGEDLAATVPRPEVRDSVLSLATVALEREHDARRLAHQATHDPLTGVANRAALVDRLQLVLARARRSRHHVGVLFCDLDGFKAVNDRYGHDRGDRLLVEVAARIAGALRPSDTVSRTGGDEFVVVCEDLDAPEQAASIAARVHDAVASVPIDLGGASHDIAISIGVAVADPVLDDPDRILRTADLAMYADKQRGRAVSPVVELSGGVMSGGDPHGDDLSGDDGRHPAQ
ncbi:hypothetical protein BH23ACT2_BH23ACT2_28930 [soil metagenome]